MMYQGVMQICDHDKLMDVDRRFMRTYSITPKLGSVDDVEGYLLGKIGVGASFNCIAEDIAGIPINRTVGFGIMDEDGNVIKEY